jgi:hypothetical protein
MKQQILEVFKPFFSFMHAFEKKKAQYVGVDARSPVQEYAVGGELPRL